MLREYFNLADLGFCELHPRVDHDLLRGETLVWIGFEDPFEHAEGTFADVTWLAPAALHVDDLLLQFAHVCGFEWHGTEEHGIEHDAGAPHIGLESLVAFAFEDFWSDVGWCTALLMLDLVLALDKFADAEVADFDVALGCQQDVVKFDISVQHSLAVHVRQTLDKLAEHVLRQVLLELPTTSDVGQEITAAADLHDIHSVRVCVERFVETHNVLVAGAFKDVVLLHDLLE